MLMDTGGNCGSQASVTVIRGISLDEIEFSDIFRVIWKEIRVAVICGATLAAANFAKLMLIDKLLFGNPITVSVALVICLTLVVTVFARQGRRLHAAAARQEDRLRPRGHGLAVHHDGRGCHFANDLFQFCFAFPRNLTKIAKKLFNLVSTVL